MPTTRRSTEVERHIRLFKNGRNQALRIPRDLELPGRERKAVVSWWNHWYGPRCSLFSER
jgi:hypothetical protein